MYTELLRASLAFPSFPFFVEIFLRIPIKADFFLNNIMLDELSIITENLISKNTKILYANKRRQLKGLPPLTPEEESQYNVPETSDPPIDCESAFLRTVNSVSWRADNKPNDPNDGNLIDTSGFLNALVYKLINKGYTKIYLDYTKNNKGQRVYKEKIPVERIQSMYDIGLELIRKYGVKV